MKDTTLPEKVYGVGPIAYAFEDLADLYEINQKLSIQHRALNDLSAVTTGSMKTEFDYLVRAREDVADMIRQSLLTASARSLSGDTSEALTNNSIEAFIGYITYARLIREELFSPPEPANPSSPNSLSAEDELALKVLSLRKRVPIITTQPSPKGGIIRSEPKIELREAQYAPNKRGFIGLTFLGSVIIDRSVDHSRIEICKFDPNTLAQIVVGSRAINEYFAKIKNNYQTFTYSFKAGLMPLIDKYQQTAEDDDDLIGAIDFSLLSA